MASPVKKKASVRETRGARAVGAAYPTRDDARCHDALAIGKKTGQLASGRREPLRGRMPKALVAKPRAAAVAVADKYAAWLLAQSGTVSKAVDLEL